MSFLTREQLDKYVKDLASKNPKTTSLKSTTRPLSTTAISSSSISTDEKKVGTLHGPRSPPVSKRNSLTATTSPKTSVFNNNIKEDNNNSSLNEIKSTPIIESKENDSIPGNSSTISSITSNISNDEKKSKYKNLDDIANDLSYPMETKLSFKPTTTTTTTNTATTTVTSNTTTTPSPPQSKSNNNNNVPSSKGADDPTKGSYVLSAAFRSSYGAASRTPSIKKPAVQPSPKQDQREIALNKKKRDSTIQELQNRSDTNWSARYDEAQQKYPPLSKLEKDKEIPPPPPPSSSPSPSQNKNNVITGETKQTVRPVSSLICASCSKPISGHVLSAMGKKWHPDHFVCKKCGITLEHVAFFEKDGDPYCHLDFHELFSSRCGYCDTPIEGQSINALGKSWHPEHFFCRECGNLFENGFMVHDGFPYCEKDFTKLFAPKCKGCNEGIKGEFTSALEGMWHRDCFVCMTCKEPFYGSYYYVSEGKPYCDKHYRNLLSI